MCIRDSHYSDPGQIKQRNKGISFLDSSTKLVATIDDDVSFSNTAISELIKFWNTVEPDTAGVGFNIINIPAHNHNWLKGLGFPESYQEFKDQVKNPEGLPDTKLQFVDGTLHILNSNFRDVAMVKFQDLFPINLTSLEFTASDEDINYFTAQVSFKYTMYNIVDPTGTPL